MTTIKKLRRKFLGILLGASVGLGFTLVSKPANAFLSSLVPMTTILEWFFERAGGVMMRYLGYRYLKNWQEAWDNYTKNRSESTEKQMGSMTAAQMSVNQSVIDALQQRSEHELKLESYVDNDACTDDIIATQIHSKLSKRSKTYAIETTNYLSQYIKSTNTETTIDNVLNSTSLSERTLNSLDRITLKELHKLASNKYIDDQNQAMVELGLLFADVKSPTRAALIKGRSDKVNALARIENIELITAALSHLISMRIKSSGISTLPTDGLSDSLKSKYSQDHLSDLLMLGLQVDSAVANATYIDNLEQNPSFSSVLIKMQMQQALTNALKHQIMIIEEYRNKIAAIQVINQ
jgi:hypothetical protein